MRTSIPWRDLPSEFEWVFLDGSIVRADQHSTGAATESSEQIGKVAGATQPKFT
ncbi:iSSod6 transposase [Vibrio orientalis CIP 102891 = ATCC 33934]|nr:iSSod6 transposase [Vibrio orientalis CIP 102891 = ATCC 33934]